MKVSLSSGRSLFHPYRAQSPENPLGLSSPLLALASQAPRHATGKNEDSTALYKGPLWEGDLGGEERRTLRGLVFLSASMF